MKKLEAKLVVVQTKKKDQQDQMEPLQDLVMEVIAQEKEENKNIAQPLVECMEMIRKEITAQVLYALSWSLLIL
jgi:hypothetical protein